MQENSKGNRFGTFGGVFTPSILTILGVIMFLRAGYVVGQAGIIGATVILVAAELISLLTALSMSAVATNTPVKGGGAYFLISRTLGAQFGGAIGLALFLAQALSVPFYIIGFTTSLTQSFPVLEPWFTIIAAGTALLLFAVNYISTSLAIRSQYIVMTVLVLSIVSFLGGAVTLFDPQTFRANLTSDYTAGQNFWTIFAIYFPAVTGILAGVNMSGDLKDPARSLVRGTMAAIGVGFLIYLSQILLCGGSQQRGDLVTNPFGMLLSNALLGTSFLVMGGVFAATLSSAVGSLMGAPRVLQALSRDRIFKILKPFARGEKKNGDPREALWLTLLITLLIIHLASGKDAVGAFDRIASVVTMFFLCTYGMINLAAFVESFGANPSFRPSFKVFHWAASLIGFLGCLAVMLLIDAGAALGAVFIIAVIYLVISRNVIESTFGDARRGFQYTLLLHCLRKLRAMKPDPKNWRPTLLVLAGKSEAHLPLIRYASWLEGGCGIVTAARVIVGNLQTFATRRDAAVQALENYLQSSGLNVFTEVVFAEHLDEGIRLLAQAHSIGPLKPNTVLLGWPHNPERAEPFFSHLHNLHALGKNILCVKDSGMPENPNRIDLWWRGRENGSLMVILAHLLLQNPDWNNATVRILRKIDDEAGREPSLKALEGLIASARIKAKANVIVSRDSFPNILRRHSQDADLIFMGLDLESGHAASSVWQRWETLLNEMPTAVLLNSSGEADLLA